MKKIFLFLCVMFLAVLPLQSMVRAETTSSPTIQNSDEKFFHGTVMTIVRTGVEESGDMFQDVRVHFDSGILKGVEKEIHFVSSEGQKASILEVGNKVIVLENTGPDGSPNFSIMDMYRFPMVVILVALFFVIILLVVGRRRGLLSILALCWSIAILMMFIVPRIAHGGNPFLISIVGAFLIVILSIVLAHGFNRRTIIASVGTLITLLLSVIISYVSILFTRTLGMGSEDAQFLISSPLGAVDLRGLLMAGIVIGTLGVLDDVTTSQSAAVEEIYDANKNLSVKELYRRGMSIGKEHIIALVNTLVLAYAGTSLPVLLLLTIYTQPLWVTLSSEMIVEEIVRTLSGSVSLILAVPITTFLAAVVVGTKEKK